MNNLLRYFAILHVRWIQYRYKKITLSAQCQHTNQNIAVLQLLQAKEYYYKQQFSPWGKYTPRYAFSDAEHKKHKAFMKWLFPDKDFEEWDILVEHHPEAITYYQNKIFGLSKGVTPRHYYDIIHQLKQWNL